MSEESGTMSRIVELVNEGMTYGEVADELGFYDNTVISSKIRESPYVKNNRLRDSNSSSYAASIGNDVVEEAADKLEDVSLEDDIYFREDVNDEGEIVLKLRQKRLEREE